MNEITTSVTSVGLFLLAALAEIGGGYLVWLWVRQEKENNLWYCWWNHTLYLWNNSYITGFKFWKSICRVWWIFYYFFNIMGNDSGQKETR